MKKLGLIGLMFLASSAMAQTANVETLDNGVKVTHVKVGTGASPKENSTVKVMYKGTFKDGRVFDQSKSPIEFGLNGVIECWTTGVQKLKVGGTAKLECPSKTAYGQRGAGSAVPPNTDLNFEVTLLEVK